MGTVKKIYENKKSISAKKLCSRVIKKDGVKTNGQLKKGYRYAKGRKIVKAKKK